jgi:dephospho-CoA kinase
VSRLGLDGPGREAAEADARSRLAHQVPDDLKAARADFLLENTGDVASLRAQVEDLWRRLKVESNKLLQDESLK